jgi:hypothetical protein
MASTTRPNGGRLGLATAALAIAALACAALTMIGLGPAWAAASPTTSAAPPPSTAAAEPPAAVTLRSYLRDPSGRFTGIEPPGATVTKVGGINNRSELVGGYSLDDLDEVNAGRGTQHGFLRDRKGRFTTIDRPGAAATYLTGTNELGQIVGISGDSS